MTVSVGIFGATGYTGLELVRLLDQHPQVRIQFVTSENHAGQSLRKVWPLAPDISLVSGIEAPLEGTDYVFLCLPHTQSAPLAAQAVDKHIRVIDLSADLRLNDPAIYEQWYGIPHPAPELLPIPYGLPELYRQQLHDAEVVANPGCYATAILLGLAPLAQSGLIIPDTPAIIDAKSGVSGAGRTPKTHTLFGEVHGNLSPYNIGRAHRHLAEVEQALSPHGLRGEQIVFSPHLLPVHRGILAAIYVQVRAMEAARQAFESSYAHEPLVRLLPSGELATLGHVAGTPLAVLSLTPATQSMLIVMVAIDNLLKGAASQAIQNFNLMAGFPETTGLIPVMGG